MQRPEIEKLRKACEFGPECFSPRKDVVAQVCAYAEYLERRIHDMQLGAEVDNEEDEAFRITPRGRDFLAWWKKEGGEFNAAYERYNAANPLPEIPHRHGGPL